MSLPKMTHVEYSAKDEVGILRLNRASKRNAVCDALLEDLDAFFSAPPADIKVVVVHGAGDHFCAGLDLAEHKERDPFGVMEHSRFWHRVFDKIQYGGRPVVAAMHGGVIGGGLELATAMHVRVAEQSTFFQLPEGRRGIFVGGGASVRVGRILGADRMTEMMLTGRQYSAEEGLRLGLCHYVEAPGQALEKAITLAKEIAANAPMSNYMMLHAIARIGDMSSQDGLFTEALATALTQTSDDAKKGMQAFLNRKK